jgi:hypothetical protein
MKRYISACASRRRPAGPPLAPLIAISLAACATTPAFSPTVVAIPGRNQSYEDFYTLNSDCRIYAQSVIPSSTTQVTDKTQHLYDVAYTKCVTARGAVVDSRLVPPGYPYPNPSYPFQPGVIVY